MNLAKLKEEVDAIAKERETYPDATYRNLPQVDRLLAIIKELFASIVDVPPVAREVPAVPEVPEFAEKSEKKHKKR